MSYAPGSLVTARGREWVVLPESSDELVMVRPLGGTDDEVTGILPELEPVEPATFRLPDPDDLGDYRSARMLRDALRLGFRSSAGPFRSVGKIAVEPRPYQLVPLLMALKLDPVRLLIADDVGIGKTIEAALVAKELLEQGDARKLAVLCPPHLAEQWQAELSSKFHIDAELVLSSTAARLERGLAVGQSIFDVHDHVIVSIDFIKSDRRRDDFIRACPELVIVDEAHTCADTGDGSRARHQRYSLVRALAARPDRHLILVTATPHSGKEGSFRSLLTLLDEDFASLPDTLAGEENRRHRDRLAQHLVQRRRPDIRHYLERDTSFPERKDSEVTYALSARYRALFDQVLDYARSTVRDPATGAREQRVRWWSALGLLRALASSPPAAAATMRTRAATADAETSEAVDEIGRQTVLDLDESEEAVDVVPGSQTEAAESALGRRLRELARQADALAGDDDAKLARLVEVVRSLLGDGFQPIVFCRFIETAEYVARELRARLPKRLGAEVEAVTGRLPSAEREARIEALAEHPTRVLVATDCLSEGVNLQDWFSAVVHYDLPWNPTRLEQREGRVDRFGQRSPEVRVVTYYGEDNQIDETVLEVLLRKHRAIRGALGISIPVPGTTNNVIEALAENVLLRSDGPIEQRLPGFEEYLRPATERLHLEWDAAKEREQRSRSLFAQHTIDPTEVAAELAAMQRAVGSGADVASFVETALTAHGGLVRPGAKGTVLDLSEVPVAVRDALGFAGDPDEVTVRFDLPVPEGVVALSRTHPAVAGLAGHVLDTALDPELPGVAARCGVMRTAAVETRTTLLLCRYRVNLVAESRYGEHPMLAEEAALLAFAGSPSTPTWLTGEEAEALLGATPSGNVAPAAARDFVGEVLAAESVWRPRLDDQAHERAAAVAEMHARVREADRRRRSGRSVRVRVSPQLPVDVVGVYVFLPGGGR
ncbi:MAG: helicase-related protein [Thermoanaerobacterales bacterium]